MKRTAKLVELEGRIGEFLGEMKPITPPAISPLSSVDVQDPLVYQQPIEQLRSMTKHNCRDGSRYNEESKNTDPG